MHVPQWLSQPYSALVDAGLAVQVPSLVVVYARPGKDPAAAEDKDIEIGIQPYGGPLRYDQVYQFLQFIGIKLG